MNANPACDSGAFDRFAEDYDEALARGVSVSGENKEFFAGARIAWLAACLEGLGQEPRHVLDFGCGTGTATPYLLALPGVQTLCGVDVSPKSLAVAQRLHPDDRARFQLCQDMQESGTKDLVFTNGVFHHIPPADRARAFAFISRVLRPGGLFALWENNPWNPGTRYVMRRIPFDRDAVLLSARLARRLLHQRGFEVLRTDFLFVFPHSLRWFRRFEPAVSGLPFGAQYQLLCRRTTP